MPDGVSKGRVSPPITQFAAEVVRLREQVCTAKSAMRSLVENCGAH